MARRLLRKDGKLVFRVIAYESPRGTAFGGLVIPRQTPLVLPKTAKSVMGTFFDARTGRTIAHEATLLPTGAARNALLKSSHVVLKPNIVRKMVFG